VLICLIVRVTFASKISITRIMMVPVFAVLAVGYGMTVARGLPVAGLRWWAVAVFVTAAASDGLDGWVARRFNQCSPFGALIDPIADKALLLTGVVVLTIVDWGPTGWSLPGWFAAIVVLRDCLILVGIKILYRRHLKVVIAPHWSGKICTASQMVALGWVMLKVPWPPTWPCVVAAVFTAWSTLAYLRQGLRILRQPAPA